MALTQAHSTTHGKSIKPLSNLHNVFKSVSPSTSYLTDSLLTSVSGVDTHFFQERPFLPNSHRAILTSTQ